MIDNYLNIPSWLLDWGWLIILIALAIAVLSIKYLVSFRMVWALVAIQLINVIFYWFEVISILEFSIVSLILGIPIAILIKKASDEVAVVDSLKNKPEKGKLTSSYRRKGKENV